MRDMRAQQVCRLGMTQSAPQWAVIGPRTMLLRLGAWFGCHATKFLHVVAVSMLSGWGRHHACTLYTGAHTAWAASCVGGIMRGRHQRGRHHVRGR
jgi:hypothetical protein